METSTARAIHDPAAEFYIDAVQKLQDSGIPFLVGGTFAMDEFTEMQWVTVQSGTRPFPF